MRRTPLLLMPFLLLGLGAAQGYTFGPDVTDSAFRQAVREAAGQWNAAAEDVNLEESEENAQLTFQLAPDERMGPDTATLTLLGEGAQLTVLVNETSDLQPQALLHEFGLLLGLSPQDEGVLSPAIRSGQPARLDERALAQLASAGGNPADLNNDGVVDILDLALLARNYGESGLNLTGDINRDGVVDDADLTLLREAYEFARPGEEDPESPDEDSEPESVEEAGREPEDQDPETGDDTDEPDDEEDPDLPLT